MNDPHTDGWKSGTYRREFLGGVALGTAGLLVSGTESVAAASRGDGDGSF